MMIGAIEMKEIEKSSANQMSDLNCNNVTIFDYLRILKKRKGLIAIIVTVVTLYAVVASLIAPKIYKASAVIMPISGNTGGGLAAMAAQFSGLPFIGGMLKGATSANQQFMAILKTRTLAEEMVNRFNLMKVFYEDAWDKKNNRWKHPNKTPTMEDAVKDLMENFMKFSENKKEGTISVSAEFRAPELAKIVANGYVEGLQQMISKNAFTMAKRNRIFIEGQLVGNKRNLLEVGKEINEFYKEGRVSNVNSRVNVVLGGKDEYEFGSSVFVSSSVGESIESWNQIENEKKELQEKLKKTKVAKNIPQQVYLQYLMLRREMLGKINSLLTQQYEMAKIEEAREDLAFQVIDFAQVPIKRFKPQRRKIVMMYFVASLFIAVFLAFLVEYVQKMRMVYKVNYKK